ncbi:class I SAM-dependent methyltransferase [Paludibacterium sp. B53371]|uniref:class I SAM-dependent methyltransferase n=1 Tax=Paludibacterium sp. B53371 TaxID=2806263 RepID=UPI001C05E585|nr:class I SAM-dependent methyltransferase [Paludibacterium sp. B53371]
MTHHAETIQQQFDPQAQAYLTSSVHADGPDLRWLREQCLPALPPGGLALDLGCGAGHLTFALAAQFERVWALDPSPAMLQTVQEEASRRGLGQVETIEGVAHCLPFADGQFDLVASRYSAHHWGDVAGALAEVHRVLRPGGSWLLIDVAGHESALVDTHLQTFELLRDRSHLRNYSETQWRGMLAAGGLSLQQVQHWPLRLVFADWVARMRTPAPLVQAIRLLQQGAPAEVVQGLQLEADGSFTASTLAMVAVKAGVV